MSRKMNKKYTKKTKLAELLDDKKSVDVMMSKGIYCMGCPMASQESIEEGCQAHGLDVEKTLKELNQDKKKE